MTNYFRITGYCPKNDVCFIADSFGLYKEIWEFSSYLVSKGIKIIAVGSDAKFKDGNIGTINPDNSHFVLRAINKGRPIINGNTIEVNGKIYTPNKNA